MRASPASGVKQHFDDLTLRVSDVVGNAAEATASRWKSDQNDPADQAEGGYASGVSIRVIGDRFDDLVNKAKVETDEAPAKKLKAK